MGSTWYQALVLQNQEVAILLQLFENTIIQIQKIKETEYE